MDKKQLKVYIAQSASRIGVRDVDLAGDAVYKMEVVAAKSQEGNNKESVHVLFLLQRPDNTRR